MSIRFHALAVMIFIVIPFHSAQSTVLVVASGGGQKYEDGWREVTLQDLVDRGIRLNALPIGTQLFKGGIIEFPEQRPRDMSLPKGLLDVNMRSESEFFYVPDAQWAWLKEQKHSVYFLSYRGGSEHRGTTNDAMYGSLTTQDGDSPILRAAKLRSDSVLIATGRQDFIISINPEYKEQELKKLGDVGVISIGKLLFAENCSEAMVD